MLGFHFGAITVNQERLHSGTANFKVTVTEEDKELFQPIVDSYTPEQKKLVVSDNEAWEFSLSLQPFPGTICWVIPGHETELPITSSDITKVGLESLFRLGNPSLRNLIGQLLPQVQRNDIRTLLESWIR